MKVAILIALVAVLAITTVEATPLGLSDYWGTASSWLQSGITQIKETGTVALDFATQVAKATGGYAGDKVTAVKNYIIGERDAYMEHWNRHD